MIHLTRINRMPLVLNADLIEHLEVTPDTVISLTNGQKFVVRESAGQVIDLVVAFRRRILERLDYSDLAACSKPAENPAA